VLGKGRGQVWHAPHPFILGGQADVVSFENHLHGVVYVTSELTGKPDATYTDYELMICSPVDGPWWPNVISRLAPYTQEAQILSGETMDIDSATPEDSKIKALLFDTYGTFTMFGTQYDIRLCLGITKDELQYKFEHGSEALLAKLKEAGVYPITDLNRASIFG
jgi:hypothetical protein